MTVSLQSKHISFPKGGVNSSEVLQQFSDTVIEDLGTLADQANTNESNLISVGNKVLDEMSHLKTQVNALKIKNDFRERNSENLVHTVDLYNKKNFEYVVGSPNNRRLVLDQRHGQIYLPATSVMPLFFGEDPTSGDIIVNNGLDTRVVSISEGVSGSYQPTITQGSTSNAFNGYNTSYWIRKVEYPLEAAITEVEMEIEVIVPQGSPNEFNTFKISPHPLGRADVTGIWYKEQAASNWTLLEEFPREYNPTTNSYDPIPVNESSDLQYIGQIRPAYAFKIGLRQRDWVVQNNKKVFIYGAQEMSANLIRYTNVSTIDPLNTAANAHIVYKVSSPESTVLGTITKIDIGPDAKTEGGNVEDNHIIYQLSVVPSPASSTDILWSSNTSALPQNGTALALNGISEYYLIISMKYVSEVTKDLSVFNNGTTPVVQHVNLVHTLKSTDTVGDPPALAVDWTPRNSAMHFQNMILMDSMMGAVTDGSNQFISWDDFWEDTTWRAALEGTIDGVSIDSSSMALTVETDVALTVGSITYLPLTSTEWGVGMNPRRIKLQAALANVAGSTVSFLVSYALDGVTQTDITIPHTDLVSTRGSIPWVDIPGADPNDVGYIGDVTTLSIKIVLANGSSSDSRPLVYQFALIVKD